MKPLNHLSKQLANVGEVQPRSSQKKSCLTFILFYGVLCRLTHTAIERPFGLFLMVQTGLSNSNSNTIRMDWVEAGYNSNSIRVLALECKQHVQLFKPNSILFYTLLGLVICRRRQRVK